MAGRLPDFLIVGTPRSGTTLVQRLASELAGVRVPPETHFFDEYAVDLAARAALPLAGDALREEVARYRDRRYLEGAELDVDAVVDALGGTCRSLLDLYGAVLAQLAGDAAVVGDKTPGHLRWWQPLAAAVPGLAVVAVVRDPRAVASSQRELGWGGHPVVTGRRWAQDVATLEAAAATLDGRCLVLRYEDVVADPEAARARLAALLGLGGDRQDAGPLFLPWETWKEAAAGPVDPARAAAWRGRLDPGDAAAIAAVCRAPMARLGYDVPGRAEATRRRLLLPPVLRLRLARAALRRRRRAAAERRAARLL
jgi:hypothetical protein